MVIIMQIQLQFEKKKQKTISEIYFEVKRKCQLEDSVYICTIDIHLKQVKHKTEMPTFRED